jgi:hypothetical protein
LNSQTYAFKKELKVLAHLRVSKSNKRVPRLFSYKFDSAFGEMMMTDCGYDL